MRSDAYTQACDLGAGSPRRLRHRLERGLRSAHNVRILVDHDRDEYAYLVSGGVGYSLLPGRVASFSPRIQTTV